MISIVVVTFNSAHVLEECIGHLGEDFELVVVDNASVDGSPAVARAIAPNAKVIRRAENGGFAVAVNEGIASATGSRVLLLNPDARIEVDGVRRLDTAMSSDARIGAVAPLLVDPDQGRGVVAAGSPPTIFRMLTHMSGLSAVPLRPLRGTYERLRRIAALAQLVDLDWVSGGCVLVRRDALKDVGGVSERWFMYAEDIDLCLRLKDQGWRITLDTGVRATHRIGQSSADNDGRMSAVWLENLFDLYSQRYNAGGLRRTAWLVVVWLGFLARELASRGRDNSRAVRFRVYRTRAAGLLMGHLKQLWLGKLRFAEQ